MPDYPSSANVRWFACDGSKIKPEEYLEHKHHAPTLFPDVGTWESVAFIKCRSTLSRRYEFLIIFFFKKKILLLKYY